MTEADLLRVFRRDRFAAGAGIRLREARAGHARATLAVRDRHLNGVDVVQGGAIFTLADLAFAAACNGAGKVALAVNVSVSFLRATRGGRLEAVAREVSRSARFSSVEVEVRDGDGRLAALFHGTAFVKDEPLPVPPRSVRRRSGSRGVTIRGGAVARRAAAPATTRRRASRRRRAGRARRV